jgi:hypothetical protein
LGQPRLTIPTFVLSDIHFSENVQQAGSLLHSPIFMLSGCEQAARRFYIDDSTGSDHGSKANSDDKPAGSLLPARGFYFGA